MASIFPGGATLGWGMALVLGRTMSTVPKQRVAESTRVPGEGSDVRASRQPHTLCSCGPCLGASHRGLGSSVLHTCPPVSRGLQEGRALVCLSSGL